MNDLLNGDCRAVKADGNAEKELKERTKDNDRN